MEDTVTDNNESILAEAAAPAAPAREQFRDAEAAEQRRSELVIAIDGPSGSGKSSVSREVARRLGLAFLDTGAMYRALTWWCLEAGIDLQDEDAVAVAADQLDLQIGTDPRRPALMVGGTDVEEAIREDRISENVSAVAKNQRARAVLVARQRVEIESSGNRIVAEGRDITTVVAPDATARILLTASEEARMARRNEQLGGDRSEEQLTTQVSRRDAADSRVVNFTEAAEGVTLVDSTELDFDETVEAVMEVIRRAAEQAQAETDDAEAASGNSEERNEDSGERAEPEDEAGTESGEQHEAGSEPGEQEDTGAGEHGAHEESGEDG
jgi:cytidylate kinase